MPPNRNNYLTLIVKLEISLKSIVKSFFEWGKSVIMYSNMLEL